MKGALKKRIIVAIPRGSRNIDSIKSVVLVSKCKYSPSNVGLFKDLQCNHSVCWGRTSVRIPFKGKGYTCTGDNCQNCFASLVSWDLL